MAADWLREGVAYLGAGGKTAAGYGYFVEGKVREARQKELEEIAERLRRETKPQRQPLARWTTVRSSSMRIPAQVKRREGNMLIVRLHVDGYDNDEFKLGGVNAAGIPDETWLYVNVAGYSSRTKKVTAISFAGMG
jgi:hypothetical protein